MSEEVTPALDKLNGAEPPCIKVLIRQGGSADKSLEAAANLLVSYCVGAQLRTSRIQLLAIRLADGFVGDSLRVAGQRQRHITSLCQQRPKSVCDPIMSSVQQIEIDLLDLVAHPRPSMCEFAMNSFRSALRAHYQRAGWA